LGTLTLMLGGIVFLVAIMFLPYTNLRHAVDLTLWDSATRPGVHLSLRVPIVYSVVGALATLLAAASLVTERVIHLGVATGASFYLVGALFLLGLRDFDIYGVAVWVALAAGVAMSVGGILALSTASFANRFAKPS
jgi:hypothetical protein